MATALPSTRNVLRAGCAPKPALLCNRCRSRPLHQLLLHHSQHLAHAQNRTDSGRAWPSAAGTPHPTCRPPTPGDPPPTHLALARRALLEAGGGAGVLGGGVLHLGAEERIACAGGRRGGAGSGVSRHLTHPYTRWGSGILGRLWAGLSCACARLTVHKLGTVLAAVGRVRLAQGGQCNLRNGEGQGWQQDWGGACLGHRPAPCRQ